MKNSSNFIIALAAAVITFGTLTLTVGPKHRFWNGHRHGWHGAYHHGHSCDKETHDDKS